MSQATIGALRVTLGLDSAAFTDGLNAAQRHLRGVGARMQNVGRNLAMIGAGMTATITAPLVAFGTQAVRAAADAEELQSAFDYSFGEMAGQMNEWARTTGDALGRSTQALQEAAFTFNQLFTSATPVAEVSTELSQRFTVLAQDLASFYNVAEDDALQKLRAGLVGEAEPLRQFGVFLTAAAVEARAMEMGLADANGEISEQAKILARAELIYEATASAQGDLARTQGSATNQSRAMAAALQEISVTVGQILLPVITPLVQKLNAMLQSFSNLSPEMQRIIVIGAGVAAAIGPILVAAGAAVAAIGALLPVLGAVAAVLSGPVVLSIAAVVAGFLAFRDEIVPAVQSFGAALAEELGPKIQPLFDALMELVGAVGDVFSAIFGGSGSAGADLTAFGEVVGRIFGAALDVITGAINVVTNVLRALGALLRGDFSAMWGYLGQAVAAAVRGIVNAFTTLFPEVSQWVRRTYEAVREWLLGRFEAVVRGIGNAVGRVTGFFRDMYIAVVGNSYVPDMVREIGHWMGPQLQAAMVNPAAEAAGETASVFSDLSTSIEGQMEGLFQSIANKDWRGALGGLFDILGGQGGKLGAFGKIGGAILGALPGFATGGSFKVGGSGGVDSQVMAFRATPGEMVDIRRPGQDGGPWGALRVIVEPNDDRFNAYVDGRAAPLAAEAGIMAARHSESSIPAQMAKRGRYRTR